MNLRIRDVRDRRRLGDFEAKAMTDLLTCAFECIDRH